MEAENSRLSAELRAIETQPNKLPVSSGGEDTKEGIDDNETSSHRVATTKVANEDIDHIKNELRSLKHDYGMLVGARNILASKVRYYRDIQREWRAYTKRWISKDPIKRARNFSTTTSERNTPMAAGVAGASRSPNIPTPPAFPVGATPSVSNDSRSTSSPQQTSADRVLPRYDSQNERKKSKEVLNGGEIAPHNLLIQSQRPDAAYSTESDEDSDWVPRETGHLNMPTKPDSSNKKAVYIPPFGSSSPIVVSERCLKRKRPTREHKERFTLDGDKLKPIKGEKPSSSIIPVASSSVFEGVHDSLDLDDVGDHLTTPRKRQRMERLRVMSSTSLPNVKNTKHPEALDDTENHFEDLGYEGKFQDIDVNDRVQPSTEDPSPLPRSIDNPQYSSEAELQRRARKNARAQNQAHNDRVTERLETELDNPTLIAHGSASSSKPTALEAYPTPITTGPHGISTPTNRREREQRKAQLASPVLRSTDLNAHLLPRTTDDNLHRKRPVPPSRRDRGAANIPALAEDGEASNGTASRLIPRKSHLEGGEGHTSMKPSNAHHRLDTLLNVSPSARSCIDLSGNETPRSPDREKTSFHAPVQRVRPNPPRIISPSSARKSKLEDQLQDRLIHEGPERARNNPNTKINPSKAAAERSILQPALGKLSESPPAVLPEHEPLRTRPLHRLSREDFRLNPAHSSYSYHEPLRRHDEKRAASPCIDRNCKQCKDQRKFVEDSGFQTIRKPGESADEADQRLLLDFLKSDNRRLERMTSHERTEALWQAKTKEYANLYGKHRAVFPRAKSPPGMWDVDFPSTQKEKENRLAADAMAREKVEERYFEALRPGGRYIFADELK